MLLASRQMSERESPISSCERIGVQEIAGLAFYAAARLLKVFAEPLLDFGVLECAESALQAATRSEKEIAWPLARCSPTGASALSTRRR